MKRTEQAGRAPIAVLVDREGLGDVLLKRPFLKALKDAYPDHPIWWIATHQTAMEGELRALVGKDVARVVAHAGLDGATLALIRRLRALPRFARVFDGRTKVMTVALTRLALRHAGFYCCLPGFILSDGRPPRGRRRPQHVAWRMNAMIECATGRLAPDPPPLTVSAEAQAYARGVLPEGGRYLGLAVGSRLEGADAGMERSLRKRWPLENFLALARAVPEKGVTPVLFEGPSETISSEEVRTSAPATIVLAPPDVEMLAACCARLSALVANDNGVGHLAGAMGVPVVSLFGPTSPLKWAPVAPRNLVLWAQDFGADDIAAIPVAAASAAIACSMGVGAPPAHARQGRFGLLQRAAGD